MPIKGMTTLAEWRETRPEIEERMDEAREVARQEALQAISAGFFDSLLSGQSTAEGKDSAPTTENETKPDSGQKTD